MSEENNKLNAELKKVDGELFPTEEFASVKPVPLDSAILQTAAHDVKPLPVSEENLTPAAEGFVPVRDDTFFNRKEEARKLPLTTPPPPAIKTFSDTRPLNAAVFDAPLQPVAEEKFQAPPTPVAAVPVSDTVSPVPETIPSGFRDIAVHPVAEEVPSVSAAKISEEPIAPPIPVPAVIPPVAVAEEPKKAMPEEKNIPVAEEPKKTAPTRPATPKNHTGMTIHDAGGSLGTVLRNARTRNGMTVEEVADTTKIRLDYVIALENDDIKRLPPVVFVRAYTRTIAQVYKLDSSVMELLMQKVKALEPPADVPEQLLQKLEKDVQVSEEETKKVKMIVYYSIAIVALIISLVVTSIVAATISRSRNDAAATPTAVQQATPGKASSAVQPFPSGELEKLIPQQLPELKVLEVPVSKK